MENSIKCRPNAMLLVYFPDLTVLSIRGGWLAYL